MINEVGLGWVWTRCFMEKVVLAEREDMAPHLSEDKTDIWCYWRLAISIPKRTGYVPREPDTTFG